MQRLHSVVTTVYPHELKSAYYWNSAYPGMNSKDNDIGNQLADTLIILHSINCVSVF